MSRKIRLLGRPAILDEAGRTRALRGYKAWALFARVLLARRPLDRQTLAMDLFSEADDPLGALRWCPASLRNALGSPDCLCGDPRDPDGCAPIPPGTDSSQVEINSVLRR